MISLSPMAFFLAFSLLFFAFPSQANNVVPVPPLNITPKDLAQSMNLGQANITFPGLYVFGDSLLDPGNNIHLQYNNPANYSPYGFDFGGKPTGRVTNGRLVVDFIAQVAGLPFPPAYLGMTARERGTVLTGVSYASSAAGVRLEPPPLVPIVGDFLSLEEQVDFFEDSVKELRNNFNSTENFAEYLANSIFFHEISNNDLGMYWDFAYKPTYNNSNKDYIPLVSQEFSKQLTRLYTLGARKFVINNVFPLGCTPFSRAHQVNIAGCDDEANGRVAEYNELLRSEILKLQTSLKGSKITFVDFYKIMSDIYESPNLYGIDNVKESCCTWKGAPSCIKNLKPCEDRGKYMYFDGAHPTENLHFIWARRLFTDPSVCNPLTLLGLIQA